MLIALLEAVDFQYFRQGEMEYIYPSNFVGLMQRNKIVKDVYVNLELSEILESFKIPYYICDGSKVEGCYCTSRWLMHDFSLVMTQLLTCSVN